MARNGRLQGSLEGLGPLRRRGPVMRGAVRSWLFRVAGERGTAAQRRKLPGQYW